MGRLLAFIGAADFFLNAIQTWRLGDWPMSALWALTGVLVGYSTMRIERYFLKQGRMWSG